LAGTFLSTQSHLLKGVLLLLIALLVGFSLTGFAGKNGNIGLIVFDLILAVGLFFRLNWIRVITIIDLCLILVSFSALVFTGEVPEAISQKYSGDVLIILEGIAGLLFLSIVYVLIKYKHEFRRTII